jgi:hypothetical protein
LSLHEGSKPLAMGFKARIRPTLGFLLCLWVCVLSSMCVCVQLWKRRTKATKKREEQYEKQLEDGNLLQPNLCKCLVVIEVCCHCQKLSIAAKVCCLHQEFSILVCFKVYSFIYFFYFFYLVFFKNLIYYYYFLGVFIVIFCFILLFVSSFFLLIFDVFLK